MCYPKPGPRCSGHAKERFRVTAKAYQEDPDNYEKYEAFREARTDLYSTPAGFKLLEEEIANTPKTSLVQLFRLKQELKQGKKRREEQMNAYHATVSQARIAKSEPMTDERTEAVLLDPDMRDKAKNALAHAPMDPLYRQHFQKAIDNVESHLQVASLLEHMYDGEEEIKPGQRASTPGDPAMGYESDDDLQVFYSTSDYCHHLPMALSASDPDRYTPVSVTIDGESAHWAAQDTTTGEYIDVYGRHESLEALTNDWEMFDEARGSGEKIEARTLDVESARTEMSNNGQFLTPYWRENAQVAIERFKLAG